MAHDSRLDRYETFVATATIGAHANSGGEGFRHRDVKFLIELFSNWVEVALEGGVLQVQNTQVARYIGALVRDGCLRQTSRRRRPAYRLTRLGLIELTSRVVGRTYLGNREQFFFVYYFIRNYGPRIVELVRAEGKLFPAPLRLELDALLDARAFVERERERARRELASLDERIHDGRRSAALVSSYLRNNRTLEEAIAEVERRFPYELNSQKPLSELSSEIPVDLRRWEFETGIRLRAEEVFAPTKTLLMSYLKLLDDLSRQAARS